MLFEKLLFPKLHLPKMTSDDALVIASGPSFDDFRIAEIEACPAVKYGCGQVFQFVHLDHYILIDPWVARMETQCYSYLTPDTTFHPETKIWVTGPVYDASVGQSYQSQMKFFNLSFWEKGPLSSAGPVTVHFAIRNGHKRVFLLGLDGSFDSFGIVRSGSHAKEMIRCETSNRQPDYCDVFSFGEIYDAKTMFGENLINLSTCSNYVDFLGVSKEIDSQPLGHVDRHSSLVAIELPSWDKCLKAANLMAKFFVERNRRQAVAVLTTDIQNDNLAKQDGRFLTTNVSLQKISAGFSIVNHITVPQ